MLQKINDSIEVKSIFIKKNHSKLANRLVAILISIVYFIVVPMIFPLIWPKNMENPGIFQCKISFYGHEIFYFLFNGFFFVLYFLKWDCFEKYKVQNLKWPWNSDILEWRKLLTDTINLVCFNHFLIVPFLLLPTYISDKSKFRMDNESLPSHTEFFIQTILCLIIEDFFFYMIHRILHINAIYPYIHKVHHRYQNTISVASEYAHPIEYVLGNLLPLSAPGLILRKTAHFSTFYSFVIIRLWKTAENHSGYEFPFSPFVAVPFAGSSSFHNYHHLFFKGNYGSFFRVWDILLGTVNKNYYKYLSLQDEKFEKKIN